MTPEECSTLCIEHMNKFVNLDYASSVPTAIVSTCDTLMVNATTDNVMTIDKNSDIKKFPVEYWHTTESGRLAASQKSAHTTWTNKTNKDPDFDGDEPEVDEVLASKSPIIAASTSRRNVYKYIIARVLMEIDTISSDDDAPSGNKVSKLIKYITDSEGDEYFMTRYLFSHYNEDNHIDTDDLNVNISKYLTTNSIDDQYKQLVSKAISSMLTMISVFATTACLNGKKFNNTKKSPKTDSEIPVSKFSIDAMLTINAVFSKEPVEYFIIDGMNFMYCVAEYDVYVKAEKAIASAAKKAAADDEDSDDGKKSKKSKKSKSKKKVESDDEDSDVPPKKSKSKKKVESDDEDSDVPPPSKKKSSKTKKVIESDSDSDVPKKDTVIESDSDSDVPAKKPTKSKKGKKAHVKKPADMSETSDINDSDSD